MEECKYCKAELEEGTSVCPHCGEVLVEQPKKSSGWKAWVAIALCAVLLIAMVAVVVSGINSSNSPEETEPDASVQTTAPSVETQKLDPSAYLVNVDFINRPSYTVSADALAAAADTVVVTAGDHTMTGDELQVYYWMQFGEFLNYYGYYAYYYFGLDESVPLDQQYAPNSDVTWEQYFLDGAINTWQQYVALSEAAKAANFELPQELQDGLATLVDDLNTEAQTAGYASADEMIAVDLGPGCTVEAYRDYVEAYYYAASYFDELYEQATPTETEIEAYFTEYQADYESQGITKETAPFADVRHILLMPKGGTADASGNVTYSEDEWEACRQAAQDVLDTWLAGEATEDSFAQLANLHSEDGGSNTTGGLYEGVTDDGTYVPEFTAWAVDASRQVGDTGLVRTDYGYHVMYLASTEAAWHLYAREELQSQRADEIMDSLLQDYPLTYQLDKIAVGAIAEAE